MALRDVLKQIEIQAKHVREEADRETADTQRADAENAAMEQRARKLADEMFRPLFFQAFEPLKNSGLEPRIDESKLPAGTYRRAAGGEQLYREFFKLSFRLPTNNSRSSSDYRWASITAAHARGTAHLALIVEVGDTGRRDAKRVSALDLSLDDVEADPSKAETLVEQALTRASADSPL